MPGQWSNSFEELQKGKIIYILTDQGKREVGGALTVKGRDGGSVGKGEGEEEGK